MSVFIHIALLGWIPVVLLLFAMLPARRAVIAAFVIGWLFLPMSGYELEGVPNFNKLSATALGVLLGIVLFDAPRLGWFRPAWFDIPMLVWLTVPLASSLDNGLGLYDGLSGIAEHVIAWGVPYFVGRLYFTDLPAVRDLAIGVFIGGLVYVPLCLYEIRMSPQLHTMVYGFHQHVFIQTRRFGGWRPTVFLQHGLAVGMWMTAASLVGVWLWQTGAMRQIRNVPMSLVVPVLFLTTLMCKSVGAFALFVMGIGALLVSKWTRSARIMTILLLLAPAYLTARLALGWSGGELVSLVDDFEPDRAASVEMRFYNEDRIAERAMQKPIFGWGRWDERYRDEGDLVTDSMWIITLGRYGLVGLFSLTAAILLPVALFMHRTSLRRWHHPNLAPAAALGVVLILFMLDSLFNSMLNPIFVLAAGGLASLSALQIRSGVSGQ